MKVSSLSSFPIPVDDISSAAKSEEIAVTFFNAAGHTTVSNRTTSPLGTVILSSNKSFIESDRYIILLMAFTKNNILELQL